MTIQQEQVRSCLTGICLLNGFASPEAMTQRDFEHLSNAIESKTGILISVSTIKRLLNGEFSRLPQTATLNAISAYLGYQSWQDYTINARKAFPAGSAAAGNAVGAAIDALPVKTRPNGYWRGWRWLAAAGLAAAALFLFIRFIQRPSRPSSPHYETALFSARKTTDNAIPNTVVFHYNIDGVNADSFFIQQSWDRRRRVRINKNSYTLTDMYYEPGYHVAKLIANDSIIKTIDISIPTDRWFLYAKDAADPAGKPQYFLKGRFIQNRRLAPGKEVLDSNQVSTAGEKTFVYCYFPSTRNVSSENFTLTARLRVKPVGNSQCPYLMCEVYCQRYFQFFKSMPVGCAGQASAMFGEHYLSGQENDLSPLCYDITQWMDIVLTVSNKRVTVYLNHSPVFSSFYAQPTGLVTGLGFISNGLCEVESAVLKGADGKLFYESDFR